MESEILLQVVSGIPNFAGFVVLAYVMYKMLDRQMSLLEDVIKECLDDDVLKRRLDD
jgi:ABC-type polysaccharide transport system permease subunit